MLKLVSAAAIAAIICVQPAAARLGGVHSVTDTGDRAERHQKIGVVSYVVEQIQISFFSLTERLHQASESRDEYQYSYTKKECDAALEETDEEVENKESKDQEPAGPEPLYFGF